jgi:hypothetical protein
MDQNILEELPYEIPYVDPSVYLDNNQFSVEYKLFKSYNFFFRGIV